MPVSLSELRAKEKKIVVDFYGEKVNVTYRPNVITPAYQQRIKDLRGKSDTPEAEQWAVIIEAVSDWDLTDDEGVLAVNSAGIALVPTELLQAIMRAISEDASPNSKSAATSGAGSRQKGR